MLYVFVENIMSVRQLCKESNKALKKAYLFPQEMKTGIAPTQLILESDTPFIVWNTVTVNWEGEKVKAEILALDGEYSIILLQCTYNSRSTLVHKASL